MHPVTDQQIRSCFINCSRPETADLPLPVGLGDVNWEQVDYLGWRDPYAPRRGFTIIPTRNGPIGIVLHAATRASTQPVKCAWCQDGNPSRPAVMYTARRAGHTGRWGSTVGARICADFQCSANVRTRPLTPQAHLDMGAVITQRIDRLQRHAQNFLISMNW